MTTTLPRLVATMKWAKTNPDGIIKSGDWTEPEWTVLRFRRWFMECLQNKINAKDPRYPRGRFASEEYELELLRLRRYIGNRYIVDWIAPVLGKRVRRALQHRLRENLE